MSLKFEDTETNHLFQRAQTYLKLQEFVRVPSIKEKVKENKAFDTSGNIQLSGFLKTYWGHFYLLTSFNKVYM